MKAIIFFILSGLIFVAPCCGDVVSSLVFSQNGQSPSFVVVDEGQSVQFGYEYRVESTVPGERFIANRPPDPFNGTVTAPTGNPSNPGEQRIISQFNVQDNATVSSGGGLFTFDAIDDGTFIGQLRGSVSLERGFDEFVGTFPIFANSQQIIVRNVAPTFDQTFGDMEFQTGSPFRIEASASDPGLLDELTFDWDLFDDGVIDVRTMDPSRRSAVELFATQPGIVPLRITVTDDDNGSDTTLFNLIITSPVPEPSSGVAMIALVCLGSLKRKRRSK